MNNYRINERGSAVILALALLSLMMILIMSFVTNALLESRIAETKKQMHNVQNISDIALNRALMSLEYCVAYNINTSYPIDRFNNFVSWVEDAQLPSPLDSENPPNDEDEDGDGDEDEYDDDYDGYIEVHSTSHSETETAALKRSYGGLKNLMDTKLYPNSNNIFLYRYPTNRDANDACDEDWVIAAGRSFKEQPRWVYITHTETDSAGNVVNYDIGRFAYAVLPDKGQINAAMVMGGTKPADRTGDSRDFDISSVISNEYDFFAYTMMNDLDNHNYAIKSDNNDPDKKRINEAFRAINSSKIEDMVDNSIFVSQIGDYTDYEKDINTLYQKFTFKPDAYPSDKGRADLNDPTLCGTDIDSIQIRVPYLSTILAENNYFADNDTFRNQVTANLKDFLDGDSDPTWYGETTPYSVTNAPDYTGNEKTPYIYHLGYFLDMTPNSSNAKTVDFSLRPEIEIIDLYNVGGSYTIENAVNFADITIKVTNATISVQAKLSIKVGVIPISIPVPVNIKTESINPFDITTNRKISFTSTPASIGPISINSLSDATFRKKGNNKSAQIANAFYSYTSKNNLNLASQEDKNQIDFTGALKKYVNDNKGKFSPPGIGAIKDRVNGLNISQNIKNSLINFLDKLGNNINNNPNISIEWDADSAKIVSIDEVEIVDGAINAGNSFLKNNSGDGIDYAKGANFSITNHSSGSVKTKDNASGSKGFCLLQLVADPRANLNSGDWDPAESGTAQSFGTLSGNLPNDKQEKLYDLLNNMEYLDFKDRFDQVDINKINNNTNYPVRFSTLAGISRGEAWKTLNILQAATITNPKFADGDAGILEYLDVDPTNTKYKINANTVAVDVWKGMLKGLKFYDTQVGDIGSNPDTLIFDGTFDDEDKLILGYGSVVGIPSRLLLWKSDPTYQLKNRGDVLRVITEVWKELYGSNEADKLYGNNTDSIENLDNDQKKCLYGLVDTLIPIIKVEQYPEEFQILIVAQSLNPNSMKAEISEKVTATEKILVTVRRDGNNFKVIKKERLLY